MIFGSGTIVQQLANERSIDEYLLAVSPREVPPPISHQAIQPWPQVAEPGSFYLNS